MALVSVFTNQTIAETFSGSHKSDAFTSVEIDGGSVVRELGSPTTEVQNTLTYTSNGSAVKIHVGTWVTSSGAPEVVTLPLGSTFGFNHITCYEQAGQLNAFLYFKVSVVTESGGVLTYNRTVSDWKILNQEMALVAGSAYPLGGVGIGINSHHQLASATTLQVGERLAIEVAIDTVGRNGNTISFEHGSHANHPDDATLVAGSIGTGPFGSSVAIPINFTEAYQDTWGIHNEIFIPKVSGTDVISWADIGTDWSVAKWQTTGAQRYVNRLGGTVRSQMWIFQDDDYLYVSTNNIDDTCIQNSDHHSLFICTGGDWRTELVTDTVDWLFIRDITAGSSLSRTPTLPVIAGDNLIQGDFVMQGKGTDVYPKQWEVPTFTPTPNTCTFANSKAWVDGVHYRSGGSGATSTAPNPNGGNSSGSYSEFKILKSHLNGWNGSDHIGFLVNLQCDVQGAGHTIFPTILGSQVDKNDWNLAGSFYSITDGGTASAKVSADEMDLRSIMAVHAHGLASGTLVSPNPLDVSTSLDSTSITHKYSVVPNDLTVATLIDATTISENYSTTPNDLNVAVSLDPTTVTPKIVLSVNDLVVATSLDSSSIATNYTVIPNDLTVASSLDNSTVSPSFDLVAQDLDVNTSIDTSSITSKYSLTPNGLLISTALENSSVSHLYAVLANDLAVATSLDPTLVTESTTIPAQDMKVSTSLDSSSITHKYSVTPIDLSVASQLDTSAVSLKFTLVASDLNIATNLDNTTLTHRYAIVATDMNVATKLDNTVLGLNNEFIAQDLNISTLLDGSTITHKYTVTPNGLQSSTSLDSSTVLQNNSFVADDLNVAVKIDVPTLSHSYQLVSEDMNVDITFDESTFTHIYSLVSNDLAVQTKLDATSIGGQGGDMYLNGAKVIKLYLGTTVVTI